MYDGWEDDVMDLLFVKSNILTTSSYQWDRDKDENYPNMTSTNHHTIHIMEAHVSAYLTSFQIDSCLPFPCNLLSPP